MQPTIPKNQELKHYEHQILIDKTPWDFWEWNVTIVIRNSTELFIDYFYCKIFRLTYIWNGVNGCSGRAIF